MRYTRQDVINQIQINLQQMGCMVSQVVSVDRDEMNNQWRHACIQGGITFLPIKYIAVPDEMSGMTIQFPFYYCSLCGKLFVSRTLYD